MHTAKMNCYLDYKHVFGKQGNCVYPMTVLITHFLFDTYILHWYSHPDGSITCIYSYYNEDDGCNATWTWIPNTNMGVFIKQGWTFMDEQLLCCLHHTKRDDNTLKDVWNQHHDIMKSNRVCQQLSIGIFMIYLQPPSILIHSALNASMVVLVAIQSWLELGFHESCLKLAQSGGFG